MTAPHHMSLQCTTRTQDETNLSTDDTRQTRSVTQLLITYSAHHCSQLYDIFPRRHTSVSSHSFSTLYNILQCKTSTAVMMWVSCWHQTNTAVNNVLLVDTLSLVLVAVRASNSFSGNFSLVQMIGINVSVLFTVQNSQLLLLLLLSKEIAECRIAQALRVHLWLWLLSASASSRNSTVYTLSKQLNRNDFRKSQQRHELITADFKCLWNVVTTRQNADLSADINVSYTVKHLVQWSDYVCAGVVKFTTEISFTSVKILEF